MRFRLLWLSLPPRIYARIKSFLVNYGLHCPVFGNSVGVLAVSCSECDSVLKLKIFEITFCRYIS